MSIGNFRENMSQQILVGIILVGRLGVFISDRDRRQKLTVGRGAPQGEVLPAATQPPEKERSRQLIWKLVGHQMKLTLTIAWL